MRRTYPLCVTALATCMLACQAPSPDDAPLEDDPVVDGKADGIARPQGSFQIPTGRGGLYFDELTLNSDGTYTWANNSIADGGTGRYHWARRHGATGGFHYFFVLGPDDGASQGGTYEYFSYPPQLRVRQTYRSDWDTLYHLKELGQACDDSNGSQCKWGLLCKPTTTPTDTRCQAAPMD